MARQWYPVVTAMNAPQMNKHRSFGPGGPIMKLVVLNAALSHS